MKRETLVVKLQVLVGRLQVLLECSTQRREPSLEAGVGQKENQRTTGAAATLHSHGRHPTWGEREPQGGLGVEVAKAGEDRGRDGLVLESRKLINAQSTARRPGSHGFPRQKGSMPPMPVRVLLRHRTGLQ